MFFLLLNCTIFGDAYTHTNNHSYKICEKKIEEFIDNIKDRFTDAEINEVKELINQSEKELWFMIKGHFITHALINLIKHTVRRHSGDSKSMTPDFLYSMTVDCKEDWENRIDIRTVVERIKEINKST